MTIRATSAVIADAENGVLGSEYNELLRLSPTEMNDLCVAFQGIHKAMPDPINESDRTAEIQPDSCPEDVLDIGELDKDQVDDLIKWVQRYRAHLPIPSIILFKAGGYFPQR